MGTHTRGAREFAYTPKKHNPRASEDEASDARASPAGQDGVAGDSADHQLGDHRADRINALVRDRAVAAPRLLSTPHKLAGSSSARVAAARAGVDDAISIPVAGPSPGSPPSAAPSGIGSLIRSSRTAPADNSRAGRCAALAAGTGDGPHSGWLAGKRLAGGKLAAAAAAAGAAPANPAAEFLRSHQLPWDGAEQGCPATVGRAEQPRLLSTPHKLADSKAGGCSVPPPAHASGCSPR